MSNRNQILIAVTAGVLATTALFILYGVIVTAVSGWTLAVQQFINSRYFVISLAVGFGIQVGLYTYLRQSIAQINASINASGKVVAVSGTTSATAMVACCAHYLVNIAPLMGLAGALSIIGQYQRQLFWVGIWLNLISLIYLSYQLFRFKNEMARH